MAPIPDSEEPEIKERASPTEKEREKEPAAHATSKPSAKRRTKTGCLTCRKRRIKCGEEKPFCKNCIKSKRDCAGYVQPLVYKQHNHGPHSAGHDALDTSSFSEQEQFQFNARIDVNISQPGIFNPFAYPVYHDEHHTRHGSLPSSQRYHYPPSDASPYVLQSSVPLADAYRRHSMHQVPSQYHYGVAQVPSNMQRGDQPWSARSEQSSNSDSASFPYAEPPSNLTSPYEMYPQSHGVAPGNFPYDAAPLHEIHPRRYSVHGFVQGSPFGATVPTLPNPQVTPPSKDDEEVQLDDDYDDIEREESVDPNEPEQEREQHFAELLGRYSKYYKHNTRQRPRVERPGVLQTAQHPIKVSPLQDERNERIFCHFVEVTGRCMTIFERLPIDAWSIPPRTLWTYTLPAAAMSQPALAHAILALGGLHIAKLQHSSEDPPLKHFTYALRRVGNLLSLPKRRYEITTLATVLLLGFYEVLAADHSRWNLHLTGATKLVLEHDYATMTRNVRRLRNHAKENISRFSRSAALTEENYLAVAGIPETLLDDEDWEIDQHVVSTLIGQDVDYDRQVHPNFAEQKATLRLSEKDVGDLKIKMDLRWWYCKQDIFQSMISGDPLLMDYAQWKYCPPRGRIGNASMPYATFDHLLLLLARLTNFGGKDRSRKQRVVASQGGQWRPPPGFFPAAPPRAHASQHLPTLPSQPVSTLTASNSAPSSSTTQTEEMVKSSPAPSANEGRVRQSKPSPPTAPPLQGGPTFHGMMPPPPLPPKMSPSFHAMNEQLQGKPSMTPNQDEGEGASKEPDLNAETEQALAEHAAMKNAFDLFAQSLGPGFEPLVNDGSFPQTSPFGAPIRYRSPAIAAIWLHYYVGRVLLYRLHPQMPPAAMVSASVTAHLTRDYAQTAGKVAAGLYAMTPVAPGDPLDPTLAGALVESTFPLLFAAVQYQDASQRGWTINKLHDIARMTGWQTSGAVAAACEIAWERMGLAGKAPPYTRSLDRNNKDARVNGTSRRVDPARAEGYSGPNDAGAEQESQFLSHDRSLIGKHGSTRVHWALGLLSVEEDIKKLDIGK